MIFLQCAGKTAGDACLIRLSKQRIRHAEGILDTHSRNSEIHFCASHPRSKDRYIVQCERFQIAEFAPRCEFGFDRECDEDAHERLRDMSRAKARHYKKSRRLSLARSFWLGGARYIRSLH